MRVFTTTEVAAEIFNTTTQTIRNWIAEGSLRSAPRSGSRREVLRIYVTSLAERAGLPVEEINGLIDAIEARERAERSANKPGALPAVLSVATLSR
jgi:DNA-binding transcriptional MerR regulator